MARTLDSNITKQKDNPYLHNHTINMGDLNVFGQLDEDGNLIRTTGADRRDLKQNGFDRTIYPGDVVNKKDPSANYGFFWYREGNDEFSEEEFEDLIEKGYSAVSPNDFWVRRWREDAAGRVVATGLVLFALPEQFWVEEQRKRLGFVSNEISKKSEEIAALAEQIEHGGAFEIRNSQEVKTSKRKIA
jgi:hypothetical protein